MKRYLLLLVFATCFINNKISAQSCGTSGPSICTPQAGLTVEGFYPSDTGLPCVNDGSSYNQVIDFVAPASADGFSLDSFRINSLTNLPCGLCWAMNSPTNTITGGGTGCIRVTGTSNEAPGEYDILVYATAYVDIFGSSTPIGPLNIDSLEGLYYYVRVTIPGDTCAPVDTLSAGQQASTPGSIVTPTISGNLTICSGSSTTLTATGADYYGYGWSDGTYNSSIIVSTGGTYTVTVYDNCASATASVSVTVDTVTATVTTSGPTTFCQGDSVILTASANTSYAWSDFETTQSITVYQSGNYSVIATGAGGCTAASTVTVVTANPNPVATITAGSPTTFCDGDSVVLTSSAGSSYLWSDAETTQAITVYESDSFAVTVTGADACSAASTETVVTDNPNPADNITANGPTTFCPGVGVTLSAPAGLEYLWQDNTTNQNDTALQAGIYSVTVTDSTTACSATASTIISVYPPTIITQSPLSQITCLGGDVTFNVAATGLNLSYQWYINGNLTGVTSSFINIASAQISDTGTYVAVVTGTCGVDTTTAAELTVSTSIVVSQQPVSQSVCQGSSVSFSVIANGDGTTYQWYNDTILINGADSAVYTIDSAVIADTGTYTCEITSSCGDTTSDGAYLTVLLTSDTNVYDTVCQGVSVSFNGQLYTNTGVWSDTLTNVSGCDSIVTLNLTVNPSYNIPTQETICSGDTFNFEGLVLDSSGVYADTMTTINGCDSIMTLTLTVMPPAITNISNSICTGDTAYFDGLSLTVGGVYTDTLSGSNSCDSIVIFTLTIANPVYDTVSQIICTGDSFNFNGIYISAAGSYTDTLAAVSTCDSVVTLVLTVNQPVTSQVSENICSGNVYNFNGMELTAGGTYVDTLAGSNTCDSIVTLTLGIYTPTQLSWPGEDTLCYLYPSHNVDIPAASPTGGFYSGSGVSGTTLTVDTTGQFVVYYSYVDNNSCNDTTSKTFTVEICNGINQVSLENSIQLYPNPVNESLIIESDLFEAGNLVPQLYNVAGQLIPITYTRQANKLICNTSQLAPGMYAMQFNVSGTVVSKRFVKIE